MSVVGDHDTIIFKFDTARVSIGVVRILYKLSQCDVGSAN